MKSTFLSIMHCYNHSEHRVIVANEETDFLLSDFLLLGTCISIVCSAKITSLAHLSAEVTSRLLGEQFIVVAHALGFRRLL